MAEAFEKGGQRAWFHDHGHWGGFFHTYDNLQISGFGAHFDQPRKIHVFIPRDYEVSGDCYPVLYCNDGDDIFFADGASGQSWQVAELLSRMYLRDQLPKMIVVAICAGDRPYEYSHIPHNGGGLEDYGRYLAKGLKPFIDSNYRTQPEQTLLLGAAQGGLAAFHTATQHPRQFPKVAALSPSFWFGLEKQLSLPQDLESTFAIALQHSTLIFAATPILSNGELRPQIYLDWGVNADADHPEESRTRLRALEMRKILIQEFGYQENVDLYTVEDLLGHHKIESWRGRLPMILQLFF
ncbi:MAG: esterase family protein [Limnothrix sp. RL_2_0]|nr:esterase family protein [Limnothrix sp. RL_2_0]